MTALNNEDPADPSAHEPVETVPWPEVTRYSGGASHEGIGGRVWIRLSDDGPEVEYVPAMPARVALSDASINDLINADVTWRHIVNDGWILGDVLHTFARAIEAAHGIAPAQGEQP